MGVGTKESICRGTTGVGTVRLCTKRSCKATCLVFHFLCVPPPSLSILDMPPKKSKKSLALKKLMGSPCYICYNCEKKGYQMACLHCNVAFHALCNKCPNAPAPQSDDEQDMHSVGV